MLRYFKLNESWVSAWDKHSLYKGILSLCGWKVASLHDLWFCCRRIQLIVTKRKTKSEQVQDNLIPSKVWYIYDIYKINFRTFGARVDMLLLKSHNSRAQYTWNSNIKHHMFVMLQVRPLIIQAACCPTVSSSHLLPLQVNTKCHKTK